MYAYCIILGKNDPNKVGKLYLAIKKKLVNDGKVVFEKNKLTFKTTRDYDSVVEFIRSRNINANIIKLDKEVK